MLEAITLLLTAAGAVLSRRGEEDLGDYLALAGLLIRKGDDAREELAALTAEIEAMVEEGRDPTAEERVAVAQRRRELSERIQATAPADPPPENGDADPPWDDDAGGPEPGNAA